MFWGTDRILLVKVKTNSLSVFVYTHRQHKSRRKKLITFTAHWIKPRLNVNRGKLPSSTETLLSKSKKNEKVKRVGKFGQGTRNRSGG